MPDSVLKPPIDDRSDHVQGPPAGQGVVELVEFGDFQCPHCARAATVIRQLRADRPASLRFAFRHFPMTRLHPLARRAAETAEAAGAQGQFWPAHDLLFAKAPALHEPQLLAYAADLGLDADRVAAELAAGTHGERIQRDVSSAARSGVNGTPTFYINGKRHAGAYTATTLTAALDAAAAEAQA